MKTLKIFIAWLPAFLWMGLIYYLSSFHSLIVSPVSWQDFVIRKAAHMGEYFILLFLIYRGANKTIPVKENKIIFLTLLLTIFYAFSDELHQTFVSGRSGKFFDIWIDSVGALGAVMALKLLPLSFRNYLINK